MRAGGSTCVWGIVLLFLQPHACIRSNHINRRGTATLACAAEVASLDDMHQKTLGELSDMGAAAHAAEAAAMAAAACTHEILQSAVDVDGAGAYVPVQESFFIATCLLLGVDCAPVGCTKRRA